MLVFEQAKLIEKLLKLGFVYVKELIINQLDYEKFNNSHLVNALNPGFFSGRGEGKNGR